MLISLTEYCKKYGLEQSSARRRCQSGGFKTAQKFGNTWVLDSEEKPTDRRFKDNKNK